MKKKKSTKTAQTASRKKSKKGFQFGGLKKIDRLDVYAVVDVGDTK